MKYIWLLLILLALWSCECVQGKNELRVYAGIGLKKPMDAVIEKFEPKKRRSAL